MDSLNDSSDNIVNMAYICSKSINYHFEKFANQCFKKSGIKEDEKEDEKKNTFIRHFPAKILKIALRNDDLIQNMIDEITKIYEANGTNIPVIDYAVDGNPRTQQTPDVFLYYIIFNKPAYHHHNNGNGYIRLEDITNILNGIKEEIKKDRDDKKSFSEIITKFIDGDNGDNNRLNNFIKIFCFVPDINPDTMKTFKDVNISISNFLSTPGKGIPHEGVNGIAATDIQIAMNILRDTIYEIIG